MRKFPYFISACVFAGALLAPAGMTQAAGPQGTVYQFTVPKQGGMYADATYYCWLPNNVGTVRTIIVHQHGCTREGDAQQMMSDVQWLSLAKKWHAVFIAPKLITGGPSDGSTKCNNWDDIANGSGNTYLAALDTLARRASHPEIKTVPWALWGHSGGAFWITAMTGAHPERVAVAVAQAGSADISNVPGALKVPLLHHDGKKDMVYNGVPFAAGRKKGALWAFAVNPFPLWVNTPSNPGWSDEVFGHAPHDMRMIAIPWIEAGLQARLPDQAGSAQLKDMDTTKFWLGDTVTYAIGSAADFTGNRSIASWFPDESFAKRWKEYMVIGTQKDSTQPPSPYNLAGSYSNKQLKLTWDSDADLETGIKTFIIYRNGTPLTTLQYNTTTLFTKATGFQRWNDGDNPAPAPAPTMTYTDNNLSDATTYTYQISTVNWSDVAGPKSQVLTLQGGQVTVGVQAPLPSANPASRKSSVFCWGSGACKVSLAAGPVDICDVRGTLLKSLDLPQASLLDVGNLAGAGAPRMLIIRSGHSVRNR
ncbi:MAG: hypothetical protein JWO30_4019 [Fibrobacteres bacterium]|nr:hypothetical protein [Fibrobacterota bacterium]